MKKLNLHEFYVLGKQLQAIADLQNDTKIRSKLYDLWLARDKLEEMLRDSSPLLEAARRAARKVVTAIDGLLPKEWPKAVELDKDKMCGVFAYGISSALTELESVLGNDMPGIASYIVSQKGIYKTDDLIAHAEKHLADESSAGLPAIAKFDIQEAGKCLAFELPTAAAFHLWRSVETVVGEYYSALTGKSFADDRVARNWAAYIQALGSNGAEEKITKWLDHIREEYRNPQTHPDVTINKEEARGLFSVAGSTIDQITRAAKAAREKRMLIASSSEGQVA